MNKYKIAIIIVWLFTTGCASTGNHEILTAINKQSEAITNLALAIKAPVKTEYASPAPPKNTTNVGYSLTSADLNTSSTKPDKSTLFPAKKSTENPLEKRVATLEKDIKKIKKTDQTQNYRLGKIEATMRRLNIAIAENGGMENTGRFVIDGSKQEAPEQIEATVEKIISYYSGLENPSGTYVIAITAYNEKGVASEKSSKKAKELFVNALKKKELDGKFSVNIDTDGKKNKKLAGGIVISNPFI